MGPGSSSTDGSFQGQLNAARRKTRRASMTSPVSDALEQAQEALVFTKNWIRSECLVGRVTDADLALSDCEGALAKVTSAILAKEEAADQSIADPILETIDPAWADADQAPADEIERLRELIVELWHESEAGRKDLHHYLGMNWQQYQAWANPSAIRNGDEGMPWSNDLNDAPHACHVMAARFDDSFGEWTYGIVLSPPSKPFTHWRILPEPPRPNR